MGQSRHFRSGPSPALAAAAGAAARRFLPWGLPWASRKQLRHVVSCA